MKKIILSSALFAILSSTAYAGKNVVPAETTPAPIPQEPVAQKIYLTGLKLSTLGIGADFAMPLTQKTQLRLNINGIKVNKTKNKDGVTYAAKLKLFTVGALLDYYPSDTSTFHISAGAYYNKNKLTGTAKPKGGTYTFNGVDYDVTVIDKAYASLTFKKFAPYIGFGWGGKLNNRGWSFSFDIGAMYHGTPKFNLYATKGANADAVLAAQGKTWSDVVNDINAQRDKTQKDIKKYKWYPVVSLGFLYRF